MPKSDHEELHRHHTLQNFYWTAWVCLLSWSHIPFIEVVYKKGPKIKTPTDCRLYIFTITLPRNWPSAQPFYTPGCLFPTHSEVWALLVFKPLVLFLTVKSWWPPEFLLTWRENEVYARGDGRLPLQRFSRHILITYMFDRLFFIEVKLSMESHGRNLIMFSRELSQYSSGSTPCALNILFFLLPGLNRIYLTGQRK